MSAATVRLPRMAVGIVVAASVVIIVAGLCMASPILAPVLFSFLPFLLWCSIFGYLGALIAIPTTLFLRALLSESKATRLLANMLGGESANTGVEFAGP